MATWNIDQGLQIPGAEQPTCAGGNNPLHAIRPVNASASPEGSAILVLQNFHRFLGSPEIIQAMAQQIVAGKQNRTFLVVLAPVVQIPIELEKLMVVVEHDLPGREQLEEIARGIATEEGELPKGDGQTRVLDAAAGLTRYEAEGAFMGSLVGSTESNTGIEDHRRHGALCRHGGRGREGAGRRGQLRADRLRRHGPPVRHVPHVA